MVTTNPFLISVDEVRFPRPGTFYYGIRNRGSIVKIIGMTRVYIDGEARYFVTYKDLSRKKIGLAHKMFPITIKEFDTFDDQFMRCRYWKRPGYAL
jgi:hypothetical protein